MVGGGGGGGKKKRVFFRAKKMALISRPPRCFTKQKDSKRRTHTEKICDPLDSLMQLKWRSASAAFFSEWSSTIQLTERQTVGQLKSLDGMKLLRSTAHLSMKWDPLEWSLSM